MSRDDKGRFARGNRLGKGRPSRATEVTYLAAIRDGVPLEVWSDIVARAVSDALNGDPAARNWLSRYLTGESPPTLTALAALQLRQTSGEDLVLAEAGRQEEAELHNSETLGRVVLSARGLT